MNCAADLQRRWYEPRPPAWWTLPPAAVFGALAATRRALYRWGWLHTARLPVPVVVVGNLNVGGTGKTPLTMALVAGLRARGFRPGVVSRGHGGSARVPQLLVAAPDATVVGDEPALIRRGTGVPVAVGARRAAAARLLLDQGADVVIADDGLQHYGLARDVEICVIDGVRRFGNGRLLPAGPLRERTARLHSVDFVVCNGGVPQPGEVPMQLVPRDAQSVAPPVRTRPLRSFADLRVHAVAGIGNPARFFAMLRAAGIDVIEHAFPDHHRYAATDFAFADGAPLLMTAKDAVKCAGRVGANAWYVPVTAQLPDAFLDQLALRLVRDR